MKVKDESVVVHVNVYTDAIRQAVDTVYATYGLEAVCTSGNDAKHLKHSMHYHGRALDIRFWDLLAVIAKQIHAHLPPWYEVIVEKDHFHIEADVKHEPRTI